MNKLLIGLMLATIVLLANGILATMYWDWFVYPAFGIPSPKLANCIGLSLMVIIFRAKFDKKENELDVIYSFEQWSGFTVLAFIGNDIRVYTGIG